MPRTRIAIVGAGVSGLTMAATLGMGGRRCVLFERTRGLAEAGYGIQISPNGAGVLHRLGLGSVLRARAVVITAVEMRRWRDNRLLGRIELGTAAEQRYGAPHYALRRTDLNRILLDAALERCGAERIRFARRCVGLIESPNGARLRFADGGDYLADIVVGADGIHSVVRRSLATDTVRFAGHAVYRALIPASRLPWSFGEPRVTVWLGPGRHCLCYPVDCSGAVNVVATVPANSPPEEHAACEAGRLADAYQGWHPRVRMLLAAAEPNIHHGLYYRRSLRRWHSAHVVVIGDAAHPMFPFLAQGAAQGIEDAGVLARLLPVPDGLEGYEAVRRPRVDRVLAAVGESAERFHLPDGPRQRLRDHQLAAGQLADQDWLYGWNYPPLS
jgi:salicylate hydroxylase